MAASVIEEDVRQPPEKGFVGLLGRVHDAVPAMLPVLKAPEIRHLEAQLAVLARVQDTAVAADEAEVARLREQLARFRDALSTVA